MQDVGAVVESAEPKTCAGCGANLDGRPATQRFCSRPCYQHWWVANRQRETAVLGNQKLAELKATGQDPRSVGETARHRSAAIADSNRRTPRRRKHEEAADAEPAASPVLQGLPSPPPSADVSPAPLDDDDADDLVWAERGRYWHDASNRPALRRAGRGKRTEPASLVLTGHGVRFQVHHGALLVRDGFTHHPQQRRERRLFPGDRALPSRILVLDGDGALSLDVVAWLTRQRIPLVLLDWQGEVVGVLGDGAASNPALRQAQLAARTNGIGLRLATRLIRAKVAASIDALRTLPPSLARDAARRKLEGALAELEPRPPATVEALRLVEGRAALAYFGCWQALTLRWKGTGRRPVPPEWHRVGLRQSLVSGTNRHATHPVNAILNYAYAVLEAQVRTTAAAAGLDPTVGYLHACHPGRAALVYDLMEPLRPRVDRLVLDFVQRHTFTPSDVILTERGVCRLHPQLARSVAGLAVSDAAGQAVVLDAVAELSTGLVPATRVAM